MQATDKKDGQADMETAREKPLWTAPRLSELPVTATLNGVTTGGDITGAALS